MQNGGNKRYDSVLEMWDDVSPELAARIRRRRWNPFVRVCNWWRLRKFMRAIEKETANVE